MQPTKWPLLPSLTVPALPGIARLNEAVLQSLPAGPEGSLADVLAADAEARHLAAIDSGPAFRVNDCRSISPPLRWFSAS
jgi:hypothetical protein